MKKLILLFLFVPVLLQAQISGSRTSNSNRDATTGAVKSIDYAHNEVHGGDHFTFTAYDTDTDDGDTLVYTIVTPNTTKWSHFIFQVDGQLVTQVDLYEADTRTNGAEQTVYNNNRNSSDTATLKIYAAGAGTADGTLIFKDYFGISTGGGVNKITGGGQSRGDAEWVLKQNTKYLFRIESHTDNNVISIKLSWYEHTNR